MSKPEKRASQRRPTNKGGLIVASGKETACVFRDRSSAGARVRALGSAQVPDRFRLVAPMEKLDVECVVIWRRGAEVGVRFE